MAWPYYAKFELIVALLILLFTDPTTLGLTTTVAETTSTTTEAETTSTTTIDVTTTTSSGNTVGANNEETVQGSACQVGCIAGIIVGVVIVTTVVIVAAGTIGLISYLAVSKSTAVSA